MKKIIIFYTSLFFIFEKAYAIPILWAVPFVLDLSILLVVFSLWVINILIFYFIKKIKILYILLYIIFLALNFYILFLIWLDNFININLEISGYSLKYIYLLFSVFWILTIFTIVFNKLYTYLSILLLILLPIPVSYHLLDDILDLKNHYDRVVESLNNRVNNTIVFTSPLILNNIIVSRDMKYIFEWNNHICRFSLSYYLHEEEMKRAQKYWVSKTDKINLYVGFYDNRKEWQLCKDLIQKDF